jgi:hypothetical protein
MGYYINRGTRTAQTRFDDIQALLSASVCVDVYDDNNDGSPDSDPMLMLERIAEDQFESGLCGIIDLTTLRANPCSTCERIVSEFVMATAAMRFPRAYGRDYAALLKVARDSVDRVRSGKDRLAAQGAPNPPVNSGGSVYIEGIGSDDSDEQRATFTSSGFGSF